MSESGWWNGETSEVRSEVEVELRLPWSLGWVGGEAMEFDVVTSTCELLSLPL